MSHPLNAIIKSTWANGLDANEALELINSVGHSLSANDLAEAWSNLDAGLDAYLNQRFYASVLGSNDFTEVLVKRTHDDDGKPLDVMAVLTPTMEIHITCEQAMKFFGLVKATV